MTYHTNHCWCSDSIYNGNSYDAEVMVTIYPYARDMSVLKDNNLYHIIDMDWKKLVDITPYFDDIEYKEVYDRILEISKKHSREVTIKDIEDDARERCEKTTVSLKNNVIDWLNNNIPNNFIGITKDSPIEDIKAWGVGSPKYNSHSIDEITVFFSRQIDALRFIEKWSCYEKPTFYFDYFNDERREMDINEFITLTNIAYKSDSKLDKLNILDKIKVKQNANTNLSTESFQFIDWE